MWHNLDNQKRILFGSIILCLIVLTSLTLAEALPTQASAQAKHISQDSLPRQAQAMNVKSVIDGSHVDQVITVFTLFSNRGDRCELVLDEKGLNQYTVSNIFICDNINTVPLTLKGLHALQTKLNQDTFNFKVWSLTQRSFVPIDSDSISLDISYTLPSYFAQIENNKVINVIMARQSHIDSLPGNYIESTNLTGKAGIGYSYDGINNKFVSPQPYPSWSLDVNYKWQAPIPYPSNGLPYSWNELNQGWDLFG